ncbi:glycosyltransferase involved in cell wall biosynthesis [Salinibacter ruber]|uniref:glycosyltransferase family 4 protein n=1 Tax=Salinibacter ruber TaxID=146919 RepID=UPI002169192C|nr:glycosyltransferase involved in cell wall biosynthesis [Salinibacter ruber]
MRILAPHPDSFGGYGGIAAASRQFLRAICKMDAVDEVVALPRTQTTDTDEPLPDALTWEWDSLGGMTAFVGALLRRLAVDRDFDLIWCGHLHLVPFALLARQWTGAPVAVHVHGIEAWEPTEKWLANKLVSRVDHVISVSETTLERLVAWSGLSPEQGTVVPNTIDFDGLQPGPKPTELEERYDLRDRYVLMTMGRLVGEERKKGFDRVLDVLPEVASERPDVAYLIVGKGPDRPRLERKAERIGVHDRVTFAGYIPEHEKSDHFRLADRFVMPSEGEGFGLVLLEALACGTPVIASTRDASRAAVAHGEFGAVVDPRDPTELVESILSKQTPPNPAAVRDRFGSAAYQARVAEVVSEVSASSATQMAIEA